jgi:hypothetical protein
VTEKLKGPKYIIGVDWALRNPAAFMAKHHAIMDHPDFDCRVQPGSPNSFQYQFKPGADLSQFVSRPTIQQDSTP